jgi:sugar phosphate permease
MTDLASIPKQRYVRVIPIAFLMYTIAFVDRNNIGLAIPSMSAALHFSPTISGLVFGIFFIGYLILQVPGGHLAERWSAKWFVFIALIVWGVLSSITGLVQNVEQLLIVRFLLGVAEGGVWPATLVLLAHWFPRRERGRANSLWILCLPVASVISSPISGFILATTHDYRILFLAEGAPAILWAGLWAIFIKDYPHQSAAISPAERDYLEQTLAEERQDRDRPELTSYRKALTSPFTWLFCLIYFFSTIPGYGISSFFPSLLKQAGLSIGMVGIVNALPYVVAIIGLLLVGVLSDRSMTRRRWVAIPALIMGVGLVISAILHTIVAPSIAILIIAGFGLYSYLGPFWATVDQVIPAETAGGTMGLINGIGNLGGFVGPYIVGYLDTTTGSFTGGFLFLGLCALAMAPLVMLANVREGRRPATASG